MKLYTDHAFHIGKPHLTGGTPCQDYAISGIHGDGAYAIVSDGCSRGRETDIGARLVAHAMKMELCEKGLRGGELSAVRARLPAPENALGIGQEDLLATVAGAYVANDHGVVWLYGDGVVAFKFRNGTLSLVRYLWNKNAPFYVAYRGEALTAFNAFHSEDPEGAVLQLNKHWYADGVVSEKAIAHSLADGKAGFKQTISRWTSWMNGGLEYVAVFTDGVMQVDGMAWEDVAKELLAFKTVEGLFAKRRLMAFIRNVEKNSRGCLDDIAYAVIRIGKEEEDGKDS